MDNFDYDKQLKEIGYSEKEISEMSQNEKEYIVQEWRRANDLPL